MIRQRGKNTWEIRIECSRDALAGKRVIGYHTFKGNKRAAQAEERRLLGERDEGRYVVPNQMTVKEYFDLWLEYKEQRVRGTTIEGYRTIVTRHIVPALGHIQLGQFDMGHLDRYYAYKSSDAGGKLSAQTIVHHHRVLHAGLEQAVRWRYLAGNVTRLVSPPRVERPEIAAIPFDELGKVVAAVEGTELYLPVLLGVATGARRSEILAIRWSDLESGRVLRIARSLHSVKGALRFEKPKTPRSRRSISLPGFAVVALRTHKREQARTKRRLANQYRDSDLICCHSDGSAWVPTTFSNQLRLVLAGKGITGVGYHRLRHSHASYLLAAGHDIQTTSTRLGHSNAATTLRIYAHTLQGADQEAAKSIDRLLGPTLKNAA
jgi:integrase